jgi:hypothetical protein
MKTATIILAAAAVSLCAAQAQWNGGAYDRPVNVTVNRYNYYGTSAWASTCGGWNNYAPWGYNGYGQPVPNGLGWTLYGFQAAAALFAPRPQAIFIQYPVYQSPAAVIIQR